MVTIQYFNELIYLSSDDGSLRAETFRSCTVCEIISVDVNVEASRLFCGWLYKNQYTDTTGLIP
jgi:hypothetical protein